MRAASADARLLAAAERVRRTAEDVLRGNWRSGVRGDGRPYAYTCPSVPRYRHLWHWDSCWHAVARARADPDRALAELRTVLRSGPGPGAADEGHLPHTVFWDRSPGWRRTPLYATARALGSRHTASIGPPVLPLAWAHVAARAPTTAPDAAERAGLARHLDHLRATRELAPGLLTIVLPDESGLDDSPQYDPPFGRRAHHLPGYAVQVAAATRRGWDARRIAADGLPHVHDVWTSTAHGLSLHAMAQLTGDPGWGARAAGVEAALLSCCHHEPSGLFGDVDPRRRASATAPTPTWSALAPALLPGVPAGVRRRVVEEHLLRPGGFGAPVGVPSVARDHPAHRPGFDAWRTWRGPSWAITSWLLLPLVAEVDAGRAEAAAGGLVLAAARHGLREYYGPTTGAGLGARRFGMSALLADVAGWALGDWPAPGWPLPAGGRDGANGAAGRPGSGAGRGAAGAHAPEAGARAPTDDA